MRGDPVRPSTGKVLKNLRLEGIKLWMVLANVKANLAEVDGMDELKPLVISRLDEAYRTLENFVRQFEARRE